MSASAPEPAFRIGGDQFSHLHDHGKTDVPLTIELLKNGRGLTHDLTGDMLTGMLGVQSTSALHLTGISVNGSASDSKATLAVSMHQIGSDGGSRPLPNIERHVLAVGTNSKTKATRLVTGHAIVSPGSTNLATPLRHEFSEDLPTPPGAPGYVSPSGDACLAERKKDWEAQYGKTASDLLSGPGVIRVQKPGHKDRIAIQVDGDHGGLPQLARKHCDNPEVLQQVFKGSTGAPVELIDPNSGAKSKYIVTHHAAAAEAAENLSEAIQAPFLHYGLRLQAHAVDDTEIGANDKSTLFVTLHRKDPKLAGHEGGPLTQAAVHKEIGVESSSAPIVLDAPTREREFAAGLFDAPMRTASSAKVSAPAAIVPSSAADEGGGAVVGNGDDSPVVVRSATIAADGPATDDEFEEGE